jgi:HK97 gp10 family phage protein
MIRGSIDGLTEVNAALAALPEAFREVAAETLQAGGAVISAEADARVPVDEGDLKGSGDSAVREDGLQVTVGYSDPKGRWVEFATNDTPAQPFLYPAFQIGARFVRKQMRNWGKAAGEKVRTRVRRIPSLRRKAAK